MKKSFLSIETSLNRIFLVLHIKNNLISNIKTLENSIEVEINQMFDRIETVLPEMDQVAYRYV